MLAGSHCIPGIAGGADVILIPEIPYSINSVIGKIRARQAAGKQFSIIVVAEGARPVGGEMSIARMVKGSFEPTSWRSRRKTGSRDRGKNGYRIAVYCIRLFTKRRHAYTFRQSSFYALWCSSGRGLHAARNITLWYHCKTIRSLRSLLRRLPPSHG